MSAQTFEVHIMKGSEKPLVVNVFVQANRGMDNASIVTLLSASDTISAYLWKSAPTTVEAMRMEDARGVPISEPRWLV